MMADLRTWWAAREPRERNMLTAGGVVALVLLLYLAIWDPIQSSSDRLAKELPRLRDQSAQFNRDAAEAERLRGQANSRGAPPPIATAVQDAAQRASVQAAIKSVQTLAPDRVQIAMNPVAFDALMRFIGDLGQDAGVAVESITTTATAEAGKVQVDGLVLRSARGQ
jgi:general secretion pathway protein M